MIKNIVFDLGNVLVEFRPIDYMLRIGLDREILNELNKLIFKNPMWNEFDRGTITIEDYCEQLKQENSRFATDIDKIFSSNWMKKMFIEKKDVSKFLIEMSQRYNIYILSNVSKYVLEYIKTLDFWKYVTGGTYSYLESSCKPEKQIYKSFFKENKLNPKECLFLDDKTENIEAAKKFGMEGIVFKDLQEVKEKLEAEKIIKNLKEKLIYDYER